MWPRDGKQSGKHYNSGRTGDHVLIWAQHEFTERRTVFDLLLDEEGFVE
jgi:hypothetical protein